MKEGEPVLVVHGRPGERPASPGLWVGLCLFLWCGLCVMGPELVKDGWRVPGKDRTLGIVLALVAAVFGPPVLALAGILLGLRRLRRSGRATFHDDRIEVVRGTSAVSLAWSELAGFRDGAAEVVQLVGHQALSLHVPTPDEATRTKVLALLDAHGVPRLEG